MDTRGRQNIPINPTTTSSMKSYYIPLLLLAASIFYQLVVLPRHFPPSHYDVLGIPRYSSIEEVSRAYQKITSQWNSSVKPPPEVDLIKVQYAYELLTNQFLKRDYDSFNIDEYADVLQKVKENHSGKHISEIDLPLIEAASFVILDPVDQDLGLISSQNFLSTFEDDKPLLLQVVSTGSKRCMEFSSAWKRIANLLDGVANTGLVELGDVNLAAYLADKKPSGQPFFKNGLPAVLAFPPGCKSSTCLSRYEGELSVDAVTNWLATSILNLPRISYHSKESLVQNFLVKSKPHQVKVILISKTGERATPFIRQAARKYSSYATFAFAMWRQEESAFWWNMFGVESAPAIVFLKDPGLEPVVFEGYVNSSMFIDLMEKNKYHVLPQLRSVTSMELGCDVHGYSRATKDTKIWYCALVAGRPSPELSKMRETMRSVQEKVSYTWETDTVDQDPTFAPAALATKQKRLTFAWLDGEAQHSYCFFHLHSEDSYETCGPRRGIVDTPRMFIVRYERFPSDETLDKKKQANNILHVWYPSEPDPVSALVAKYNGSSETSEIIGWISQTIKDGDTREIPPFKTRAPELIPEDADQQSSKMFVPSGVNIKHWSGGFVSRFSDYLGDPRIGPSLLLLALMSSGYIWLNKSRSTQAGNQNEPNQTKGQDEPSRRRRPRRGSGSNQLIPPSVTDEDPKNAEQIELSESDSE